MDNIIDIIVYSKVNISEFDFTSFYGEISWKPIKVRFTVIP
jgi:hypothetical protein